MPLMGSIYVGTTGLQTSQNALHTTGHNLTNVDTAGYTRQQILQSSRIYNTIKTSATSISNQQVGLGVLYSKTRAVRDVFLDQTFRKEAGRQSFYEASANTMEEVESLLGELDGEEFSESITNFWTSIQELVKDPTSATIQGLFVQRAAQLTERSRAVYEGLSAYQDNLNSTIISKVDTINEYGKKIAELNDAIVKIEVGGVESANDLHDQRDLLLDELAKLANISYTEDIDGYVSIQIEGCDFLKGNQVFEIQLQTDNGTGFVTPYWDYAAKWKIDDQGERYLDISGAKLFNLTQTVSSQMNTDVGELRALMLARGDKRANYEDLQDTEHYNLNISQSVIMNVQAELDMMMHIITTKVNQVLEDGGYDPLFMEVAAGEGFSIMNLEVNEKYIETPSSLGFIKADDKADYETATALATAFQEEIYTLNPNVQTKVDFLGYYNSLVTQVANSGSVYDGFVYSQTSTVNAIEAARQQIVGVSSDEELEYMIMFQNAYNASSRYINVICDMLDTLIQSMAV